MRVILYPRVRTDVYYDEDTKDMSVVLVMSRDGNPYRKRDFITTIEEGDTVRNALCIIIYAVEERKFIIKEYVEFFR